MGSLIGFALGVVTVFLWAALRVSSRESRKEEKEDPCATCCRWWECNGVDQDDCPMWKKEECD